jgi:hypothetical protein
MPILDLKDQESSVHAGRRPGTDTSDGSGGLPRPSGPLTFGQVFFAVFLALCAYGLISGFASWAIHGFN